MKGNDLWDCLPELILWMIGPFYTICVLLFYSMIIDAAAHGLDSTHSRSLKPKTGCLLLIFFAALLAVFCGFIFRELAKRTQ